MFLWRNVANYPRIIPVTPYLELCQRTLPITQARFSHLPMIAITAKVNII